MEKSIELVDPTRAFLHGFEEDRAELEEDLQYVDQRIDFALKQVTQSIRRWERSGTKVALVEKLGEETYETRLQEMRDRKDNLKKERKKTVLFEDKGEIWTYSGLAPRLAKEYGVKILKGIGLVTQFTGPLEWHKKPKFQDRPYQVEALEAMLEASKTGPCGVELPTGSGKSTVVRNIVQRLAGPFGAVVMAPSKSIAYQLHRDLVEHFGERKVGFFGDGKKQAERHVVVGIDDSLARAEPGTKIWRDLSAKGVFIADEAHLTPSNSLQKVCFGVMAQAGRRFFVSATMTRTDGRDLVLEGIVGRVVCRKTIRELVDQGYLARPSFRCVQVLSHSSYKSPDANRMTRKHLYYNPLVNRVAGDLTNRFVSELKRPTLILVKELEQFMTLLPHIKQPVKFAHGPLDKEGKLMLPQEFHDDDPNDLVERFNAGEFPVLVGTSCITTGTDVRANEATLYLVGDQSEIAVRQGAIGRSTRGGEQSNVFNHVTGAQKRDCVVVDFDVVTDRVSDPVTGESVWDPSFIVHRHAQKRCSYYASLGCGEVKTVDRTRVT